MGNITPVGLATLQALSFYPDLPAHALAKHLRDANPALFPTVEHARWAVRYYRGQAGGRNRNNMTVKEHIKPAGTSTDGHIPLPEPLGERDKWEPVNLRFDRALLLSDVHIPYHDKTALDIALGYGQRRGVDCIIVNGDVADFYGLSFFEKDPRQVDFVREVKLCRQFFDHLRQRFPRAQLVFKEGNHEERLQRYIWRNAPMFAGLDGMALPELFNLEKNSIRAVLNKKPLLLGEHLYCLHGHEFRVPMTNPVNPARGLYLRTKANAICGDLHQTSQHTEAGLAHVQSCWSVGCLCELHPNYMPLNKWNHGFAIVELSRAAWSVQNHKIIAGEVV